MNVFVGLFVGVLVGMAVGVFVAVLVGVNGTQAPSMQRAWVQSASVQQALAAMQRLTPPLGEQQRSVSRQQASPQTAAGRQQNCPLPTQTPLQQPSTEQNRSGA